MFGSFLFLSFGVCHDTCYKLCCWQRVTLAQRRGPSMTGATFRRPRSIAVSPRGRLNNNRNTGRRHFPPGYTSRFFFDVDDVQVLLVIVAHQDAEEGFQEIRN